MTDDAKVLRTFDADDGLPDLPLSDLELTLQIYLESVRPHVTPEQLERTRELVRQFKDGVGAELHEKLKQRASEKRNWLEEWWLKYAYLVDRSPLSIGTNFGGIWLSPTNQSLLRAVHGPNPDKWKSLRAKTMATFLRRVLQFWLLLRREQLPPNRDARGNIFSMNQFKYIFNTTRIPGHEIDQVKGYFKPEIEGSCPNHIAVIHRGRFFICTPFREDMEPWTEAELEKYLIKIETKVAEECKNPIGIGTLTTSDRETWAKMYEKLRELSPTNGENLELINSSILIAILDDSSPQTDDELLKLILGSSGDFTDFWADKSISFVATKNGLFGSQSEHSPFDGMTSAELCGFTLKDILVSKAKKVENNFVEQSTDEFDEIVELNFDIDDEIRESIEASRLKHESRLNNFSARLLTFEGYGKNRIKEMKIHPDTFVQIALQVAAYKTHNSPLATYETATTRQHFHGRTETCRSCTIEAIDLAHGLTDRTRQLGKEELLSQLLAACAKHNALMEMGKLNRGCDRHLLGLQILARESGLDEPDLFKDPAFVKSGGKANFKLSTSLCGFTTITGACPPMVKNGYGVFYGIIEERILVWITTFNDSQVSDESLWNNLTETFLELEILFK